MYWSDDGNTVFLTDEDCESLSRQGKSIRDLFEERTVNKVYGGTPIGNKSLCATCRYAQTMRGVNMQEQVRCLRMGNQSVVVTYPVEKCSGYDDKRMPSLYDMEQIAWNIKCRVRGQSGFATGEQKGDVDVTPPNPANMPPCRPITG